MIVCLHVENFIIFSIQVLLRVSACVHVSRAVCYFFEGMQLWFLTHLFFYTDFFVFW
jgi:hypothetical protein